MAKHKTKKENVEHVAFQLKADKNFKMKSSTKAMLALGKFRNAEDRNAWKRAMIGAQLAEEAARRASVKRDQGDVSV